jgi:hypothetical protein
MAKVEGPVGVPLKETNTYNQGKGGDATTPKKFGPAVGHVSGGPSKGGGINRAAKQAPEQGSPYSGTSHA